MGGRLSKDDLLILAFWAADFDESAFWLKDYFFHAEVFFGFCFINLAETLCS